MSVQPSYSRSQTIPEKARPAAPAKGAWLTVGLLFLFSDVGPDDAPTRIRLGSHLDAARVLCAAPKPPEFFAVAGELERATRGRPEGSATGSAGDVWLCHPYLVHAAQPHRGTRVRFMAQPPLAGTGPIDPHRADRSPVEEAVHRALHADAS